MHSLRNKPITEVTDLVIFLDYKTPTGREGQIIMPIDITIPYFMGRSFSGTLQTIKEDFLKLPWISEVIRIETEYDDPD